jgi:hypothetical protein
VLYFVSLFLELRSHLKMKKKKNCFLNVVSEWSVLSDDGMSCYILEKFCSEPQHRRHS